MSVGSQTCLSTLGPAAVRETGRQACPTCSSMPALLSAFCLNSSDLNGHIVSHSLHKSQAVCLEPLTVIDWDVGYWMT